MKLTYITRTVTLCLAIPLMTSAAMAATVTIDGVTLSTYAYGNGPADTVGAITGNGGWPLSGLASDLLSSNGNTLNFLNGNMTGKEIFGGFMEASGSITGNITASNNTVIKDNSIGGNVYGGWADAYLTGGTNATANQNSVTLSGNSDSYYVSGGYAQSEADTATTNSNIVNIIENSTVDTVVGGHAYSDYGTAIASSNTVNITDGSTITNDVYGGHANSDDGNSTANSNSVSIDDSAVSGRVFGGYAYVYYDGDTTASNNTVSINDSAISARVHGGYAYTYYDGNATANSNTVKIDGGTISGRVYGGYAYVDEDGNATASNNKVSITDITTYNSVFGGYAYVYGDGDTVASNNIVNITDSTVSNYVYGGYADYSDDGNATANDNIVNITGSTITGYVYGGYADADGDSKFSDASGNKITIMDSTIGGRIYGGYSVVDGNGETGRAINNTVTIGGASNLSTAHIYGGYAIDDAMDAWTGNTLNVKSSGMDVKGIYNFANLNFYLPDTMVDGETMLTVTGDDVDITGSKISVGVNGGTSALAIGDTVTLIDASANGLTADQDGKTASGIAGIANIWKFGLSVDGDMLQATAVEVYDNPQTKALSEAQLGGLAFLNQGADLAAGTGMSSMLSATAGQNGMAAFAAMGGGSSKYTTGSHVDVKGVSFMAGVAKKFSDLTAGAFIEGGFGSYDSFNSFNGFADVKGSGNTSYMGGGLMGRYEIDKTWYGEASLRAGAVKTNFVSGDILNGLGGATEYDTSAMYMGAHVGAGYIRDLDDKFSVDMNTKLFWTYQGGSDVEIAGDAVAFGAANSIRSRTGARFMYAATEFVKPYAGAYLDYEFGGNASATINGTSIDVPTLGGATGVGELGLSVQPSSELPLTIDAGIQGYAGIRQGFSGSLQLKYVF